jgi:hypothetical protein
MKEKISTLPKPAECGPARNLPLCPSNLSLPSHPFPFFFSFFFFFTSLINKSINFLKKKTL